MNYPDLQKATQLAQKIKEAQEVLEQFKKFKNEENAVVFINHYLINWRNVGSSATRKELAYLFVKAATQHLQDTVDSLNKEFEAI